MTATYIIWDEHGDIVIRDVYEKWHARIRSLMLEQYFKTNYSYKILNITEEEGVEEDYLSYVDHVLKNECSIVAINEKTDTIYAVALLKWMTKYWHSWIHMLHLNKTSKWKLILELWYSMSLEYCRENPGETGDSLHAFEYFVTEELQSNEEFMAKFFNAICEVGRHMMMPRVTFVALDKKEQDQLSAFCFQRTVHIIFAMYVTNEGTRPFGVLRDYGEQLGWLYERRLEPLVPYYEMLKQEKSSTNLKSDSIKMEKEELPERASTQRSVDD